MTGWIQPTTVTSAGSSAISSRASRRAAAVASSPASIRPPGKLTSPRCVRIDVERRRQDHSRLPGLLEEHDEHAGVDVPGRRCPGAVEYRDRKEQLVGAGFDGHRPALADRPERAQHAIDRDAVALGLGQRLPRRRRSRPPRGRSGNDLGRDGTGQLQHATGVGRSGRLRPTRAGPAMPARRRGIDDLKGGPHGHRNPSGLRRDLGSQVILRLRCENRLQSSCRELQCCLRSRGAYRRGKVAKKGSSLQRAVAQARISSGPPTRRSFPAYREDRGHRREGRTEGSSGFGEVPARREPTRHHLGSIPEADYYFFCVRDPIDKYVSGFLSRKRQGQPRTSFPGTRTRAEAFARFDSPDALAVSLSAGGTEQQDAEAAMRAIRQLRRSYWDWFRDPEYFKSRADHIVWVGRQESLDLKPLAAALGVESLELPTDPGGRTRARRRSRSCRSWPARTSGNGTPRTIRFSSFATSWVSSPIRTTSVRPEPIGTW